MPSLQQIKGNFQMNIQREDHSVTVIHGPNDGIFDLAGSTVAVVQRTLVDAFNLRSNVIAFVNGEEVESTFTLSAGDRLEFVYRTGTKGLGDLLTPEDLMSRWRISPEEYQELKQMGLPTIPFKNGTFRHPEVAVEDWWKSLGFHSLDVQTVEQRVASPSWVNLAAADPPLTHQFGPVAGNQEQLGSWLHPHENPDPRYLKGRAENGVVWVRKVHARRYEVWFRSKRELDQAITRRDRTQMKPPEPT